MVEIQRSRRKTLQIQIKNDGGILVKSPMFTHKLTIDLFLEQNSGWIKRKQQEIRKLQDGFAVIPGRELPYKGERFRLELSDCKKIHIEGDKLLVPKDKQLHESLIKWYRENARKHITQLVDEYTNKLGITYNKIYIKSQKSRWGSCSGKRNLNFNWRIVLFSEDFIRYLVIHEVMHLIEMNHSVRFWNLVKEFDPWYREHRDELQKKGYLLTFFLND